jgi:hypothetical protein
MAQCLLLIEERPEVSSAVRAGSATRTCKVKDAG